jgi:hypothetical protein
MSRAIGKHINWRIKCTKKFDPEEWITIKEYAQKHYLDYSSVRYRIATYKLKAYRHRGRWYVKESPRSFE